MGVHGHNLVVRRTGGVLVAGLARADVIDLEYIAEIGDELRQLTATLEPPNIVIDFERVRFLCSAALGMLVDVQNTVRQAGGDLRMSNVDTEVYRVFELTRLHEVIRICDDTEQAVNSFTA